MLMCFTWLCQCHLELEKAKRLSFFYLGYFLLSKNFNHVAKGVNIFHFKLSSSCRLPNFHPLRTDLPSPWLTLLQPIDFWHGKTWPTNDKHLVFCLERFWHLVWTNLMFYIFPILLFLIPLYIFQIYDGLKEKNWAYTQVMLKPCKTLFINTWLIWKMYKSYIYIMKNLKDIMSHKLDVKISPFPQMITCVTHKSIQHPLYIILYIWASHCCTLLIMIIFFSHVLIFISMSNLI